MSIVFITIPGEQKREFINRLYKDTGGGVSLVVIQKTPGLLFLKRLSRLYKNFGPVGSLREIFYAILLRLDIRARKALDYFRERTKKSSDDGWLPPTIEVESVNSDVVHGKILDLSPSLLVVWGSTILEEHILKTAPHSINLHLGQSPYYRGAVANQRAVFLGDLKHVGATIHHINGSADAGNVIEILKANASKPPREMFRDLNDRAEEKYLDVARRIFRGERVSSFTPDLSRSENFLLKNWSREMRYKLGKKILEWEKTGRLK